MTPVIEILHRNGITKDWLKHVTPELALKVIDELEHAYHWYDDNIPLGEKGPARYMIKQLREKCIATGIER